MLIVDSNVILQFPVKSLPGLLTKVYGEIAIFLIMEFNLFLIIVE
jgi:hypothetical protein